MWSVCCISSKLRFRRTTYLDHRAVQFNGLVWQNIDSEVLSQPRILFDFMCLYTVIGHTSQLKDPPKIEAIRDENHTPIIVRSHQQTVPIRLYYSRKLIFKQFTTFLLSQLRDLYRDVKLRAVFLDLHQ